MAFKKPSSEAAVAAVNEAKKFWGKVGDENGWSMKGRGVTVWFKEDGSVADHVYNGGNGPVSYLARAPADETFGIVVEGKVNLGRGKSVTGSGHAVIGKGAMEKFRKDNPDLFKASGPKQTPLQARRSTKPQPDASRPLRSELVLLYGEGSPEIEDFDEDPMSIGEFVDGGGILLSSGPGGRDPDELTHYDCWATGDDDGGFDEDSKEFRRDGSRIINSFAKTHKLPELRAIAREYRRGHKDLGETMKAVSLAFAKAGYAVYDGTYWEAYALDEAAGLEAKRLLASRGHQATFAFTCHCGASIPKGAWVNIDNNTGHDGDIWQAECPECKHAWTIEVARSKGE